MWVGARSQESGVRRNGDNRQYRRKNSPSIFLPGFGQNADIFRYEEQKACTFCAQKSLKPLSVNAFGFNQPTLITSPEKRIGLIQNRHSALQSVI